MLVFKWSLHLSAKSFLPADKKFPGKIADKYIFFSEQPFYGNYSTLESHTNTVISHALVFSPRWLPKPWQALFSHTQGVVCFLGADLYIDRHRSSLRKHSQPTFRNITINFPAKLRLTNERWNSILMTRHYPDLGSASDWSCREGNLLQPVRNTTQIWVGVISMESLRSFLRRFYAGKPLLASWKVGCFLKRNRRQKARY